VEPLIERVVTILEEARSIEAGREGWSVTYLERQIHTQLFMRLLKSRNKAGVMDLAKRGQTVERPIDLMKSPVVLDFLDLPDSEVLHESDLESAILSKLSQFLLELGKGFAFVARQKR
jgi:predicted nuclease of restriction endonuclease-like (RecB) superfamily